VITAEASLLARRYAESNNQMYPLEVVHAANFVFIEIATSGCFEYNDQHYECDVDAHIHLTEENPWPNEKDVRNAISAYQQRVNQWELALRLRPNRLRTRFNQQFEIMG
jgi:hypothetical protein